MTETTTRTGPDRSGPGGGRVEPVSPVPRRSRRPSWFDLRLVAGVVLVLGSVLAGALVISSADHRTAVWALDHDVAAGTVLGDGDVHPVRVQLGAATDAYLASSKPVVGAEVRRELRAGQLLAASDIGPAEQGVTVTIPILPANAPKISSGDRITVWLTTKTCRGVVVLSGVAVQDVRAAGSSALSTSDAVQVLVRLSASDAARIVSALSITDGVIRAGVLSPDQSAATSTIDLDRCAGTGS